MRILLYGGTFDPPHNGHCHNLQAAAGAAKPDRIIVMPAGTPPHKAASSTPAALRYEMCRACFEPLAADGRLPAVTVSDWEIGRAQQGLANYTVDTLEMLARNYPGAQLFLAVGSDMLLTFTGWRRWQDILRLASLVCQSREQGDSAALRQAADALCAQTPGAQPILLPSAPAHPLASSGIRAAMAAGQSCEALVPPGVWAVIRREGLYRAAE